MRSSRFGVLLLSCCSLVFSASGEGHGAEAPPGFTRLVIEGDEEATELVNQYLWRHFSTRIFGEGLRENMEGRVLYCQEYLTLADLWVNNAVRPGWARPIQDIHRENLLGIALDEEGYVWSHQHFSYAHEHGWPFPLWTQALPAHRGLTAGWHFQEQSTETGLGILLRWKGEPFTGEQATQGWALADLSSRGIVNRRWRLDVTGPNPSLTWPEGVHVDAANAPYLQLRWSHAAQERGPGLPCVEWMRLEDSGFSPERRMYFGADSGNPRYEEVSGVRHSVAPVYRHPQWNGTIKRLRIVLAPEAASGAVEIDSFFTAYDTRHASNNPVYILACWNYFRWTGDVAFLQQVAGKMRRALRYQQTVMGGLEYEHIRNTWPGHDGRPGYAVRPDGVKVFRPEGGIGSNYFDLLPFGWDDMYATSQYYAATRAMADLEEAIASHPEWNVPRCPLTFDPHTLRDHAAAVKRNANAFFWNEETGRFVGCIDADGVSHDYGFTFVNLEAIWYGIADDGHAADIMAWLDGARLVEGDTSTGSDIYRWRLGPRTTTRRNVSWYQAVWHGAESVPWGGQVQDGGAVLGFTFFDLWARLHVLGPDSAWARFGEVLAWEREVRNAGGYRAFYRDGVQGTTLQGGGPAGGIGIDNEFVESSLVPSILVYGFLGLRPGADGLAIAPRLPTDCPGITVRDLRYRGARLDVAATQDRLEVRVKAPPPEPIRVLPPDGWSLADGPDASSGVVLRGTDTVRFTQRACAQR